MNRLTNDQKIKLEKSTYKYHLGGKIQISPKLAIRGFFDLSKAYTPGVGKICEIINKDPSQAWSLTSRSNSVAIVSDGSAVLGLGNLGPLGSLPILEGKAVLMKQLAGVDGYPITIQDSAKIVQIVEGISSTFGGINLEDISAPHCFDVDRALRNRLSIPVMHDDQSATSVVVLAGLLNALKLTKRNLEDVKAVMLGAGAAGIGTAKLLIEAGIGDLIVFDSLGPIYSGRGYWNAEKEAISKITNLHDCIGPLEDALEDADVFIGLSVANALASNLKDALEIVDLMSQQPILFCLANPDPEIPVEILDRLEERGAIIATGRSDRHNQLNNVLAFPGIFRGALDIRAEEINQEMLIAAARALRLNVEDLRQNQIIPHPLNLEFHACVAEFVAQAAVKTDINRKEVKEGEVYSHTRELQFLR